MRFASRRYFILWMEENLPHPDYRGVEINRIDNDGHYEPGNLNLVTRRENLTNTRRNTYVTYRSQEVVQSHVWHLVKTDYPDFGYGSGWTNKLLGKGVNLEEIIDKGHQRTIIHFEVPNPETVAIYRSK